MDPNCPPYQNTTRMVAAAPPALTPGQQQALAAVEGQRRITPWPYYSKIKFTAVRTGAGAGPFTYDIAAGTVARAFSYGVSDPKVSGGFTTADGAADISDTNLTQRNQTIGGQNVMIHGIALQVMSAAFHLNDGEVGPRRVRPVDYLLLAALFEAVSVELSLNGDENRFRLGTMGMIPGAGGLSGGSPDLVGRNALNAANAKFNEYGANGWTVKSNFKPVPYGVVWRNQSNADSNLNLIFTVQHAIRVFSGGSPENNIAGSGTNIAPAAADVGYAFPTELPIEIMAHLVGEVVGPRTRTA